MADGVDAALGKMESATAHLGNMVHARYPNEAIMYVDVQHSESELSLRR